MSSTRYFEDTSNVYPWSKLSIERDEDDNSLSRAYSMDDGRYLVIKNYQDPDSFWIKTISVEYPRNSDGFDSLSKIYYSDGSLDVRFEDLDGFQGWKSYQKHYDQDGHLTQTFVVHNDGTAVGTNHYVGELQLKEVSLYNADLEVTSSTVYWQNGNRDVSVRDIAGTETWWISTTSYNAAGERTGTKLLYDDGSSAQTQYDLGGAAWAKVTASFDAAGRMTAQNVYLDDGGHSAVRYDAAATQAWQSVASDYDAAGHLLHQRTLLDDGATREVFLDAANTGAWSKYTVGSDAQGTMTSRALAFDAGGQATISYDVAGLQSWTFTARIYRPDGQLGYALTLNDDMSTVENLGKSAWQAITDEAGIVAHRTAELGNGMTIALHYDVQNSEAWAARAVLYDAGQVPLYTASIYDDGHVADGSAFDLLLA